MALVDTHCHLDEQGFDVDRDAVVSRALSAGVHAIVTIGTVLDTCRSAVELAERYPRVWAAVGVHPNYVLEERPGDWDVIAHLATHPRVAAIGETGLDWYWKSAPLEQQQASLRRHFELGARLGKPVVLHCRDAEAPMREALARAAAEYGSSLRCILHSFTGSAEFAAEAVSRGHSISFAGMVTYKKSTELRSIVAGIPRDRILLETDAPYLAPQPVRGKRNEPAYVKMTAECVAELACIPFDEFAAMTTANAERLFGFQVSDCG
jgi:TatD DNase family protein